MEWVRAEVARGRSRSRSALFASVAGQPRSLLDSVRRRLILVVLLALAPIAALNFLQGFLQLRSADEEARQRLLQRAVSAASTQENIIASAENVLHALKNVEEVRTAATSCQATLHGAVVSLPFVANIGVLDAEGRVLCSALPGTEVSVSGQGWWKRAKADPRFSLSGKVESSAANARVLVGVLPLLDPQGAFEGAIALGIDVPWLDNLLKQQTPPSQGVVALFSPAGEELVSNTRQLSATLFDGAALKERSASAPRPPLKEAVDAEGRRWTYATAELGRNGLLVAFALPTDRLFRWTVLTVAASFALPALIVVFSLVALWLAVDRIILQWLLYLRRVTAVYAQGHYGFRPARFDAAPSEFRVLGHAVENMALAVRERDARLREGLAEKTALVREIHHRIKNSLQIVVSLLSLYGSGIGRGEDRRRFDQLRTRVNTLALVHRILYEAAEGSEVRLRELLRELAAMLEGAADSSVHIAVRAEDVALPTDMAVPLALMVVEVVLNFPLPEVPHAVPMTLSGSLTEGVLTIRVSAPSDTPELPLTAELANGFATQLSGSLTPSRSDGYAHVVGAFPCRRGGH